ncbi:hypothetical protein BDZ89DRAFT_1058073, partial [Hymenopellis radicata]
FSFQWTPHCGIVPRETKAGTRCARSSDVAVRLEDGAFSDRSERKPGCMPRCERKARRRMEDNGYIEWASVRGALEAPYSLVP